MAETTGTIIQGVFTITYFVNTYPDSLLVTFHNNLDHSGNEIIFSAAYNGKTHDLQIGETYFEFPYARGFPNLLTLYTVNGTFPVTFTPYEINSSPTGTLTIPTSVAVPSTMKVHYTTADVNGDTVTIDYIKLYYGDTQSSMSQFINCTSGGYDSAVGKNYYNAALTSSLAGKYIKAVMSVSDGYGGTATIQSGITKIAPANTAPTAPSKIILPDNIHSDYVFEISWSGAADTDGNLKGYYVQRSIDGGATWKQIYQGTAALTSEMLTYGTAQSAMYRVKAYDASGLESSWYTGPSRDVINNFAPNPPNGINIPNIISAGTTIMITWGVSEDADANLAGYKLERSIDHGILWEQIYSGTASASTDSIQRVWETVSYRVRAYDLTGDHSEYTVSPVRLVDSNSPPVISCSLSGNIGTKIEAFSVPYTVNDTNGDTVSVSEAIDGIAYRTYSARLNTETLFTVSSSAFMELLNGIHTLTITATDEGGKSALISLTFTKAVYGCSVSLAVPMETTAMVAKMIMNVTQDIPVGAEFTVLVTNNPFDDIPVWEDATQNVRANMNYVFKNTVATSSRYGMNFKVLCDRNTSAIGGYIASIGGAFQ